ncbi:Type IV secretory pathway VirD2 component [Burkholderia dolosa AU0158]|nr:Type IV secretory pathway VirD2 component [Burkholderia dolosa AU0158]
MTLPKIYVDGILQTWGDELYGDALRPVRPRKAGTGVTLPPRRSSQRKDSTPVAAARVRQMLKATTKKVPEVVVKISGGGRGMKAIRAHLDYISRNGEVVLENQDGDKLVGSDDIRYLKRELQHGGFGIPEDSTVREAFNIVFSMPPGTDRAAVHDSVRALAADEFGGDFRYVFACHTDEAHPHVHLCVMARSNDGTRLNPRKADLQSWRESFAEHLREHGIEANATRRQARGVTKRAIPQPVTNMREKRDVVPDRPRSPMCDEVRRIRIETDKKVIRAYGAIARAMAESEDVGDRTLAVEIVNLVKQMPAVQLAYDPMAGDRPGKSGERHVEIQRPTVPGGERVPDDPTR